MKRICFLISFLLLAVSSFAQQRTETNRRSPALLPGNLAKECPALIEGITPYTANKSSFPGIPVSLEELKSVCSGRCPIVPPTPWAEFVKGKPVQRFGDERSFVYVIENDFYLVNNAGKTIYRTLANVTVNGTACGTWEVEKK